LRTAHDTEQRLRRDVIDVIGELKLEKLHRRDAHRIIDRVMDRGAPQSASRVFADFRSMVRWGVARGYLDSNPLDAVPAPGASEPRSRVLDDDEIRALWSAWPEVLGKQHELVLKLCLTTAQRVGEVTGMTTDELDLKNHIWTIPAERTKNGYEHKVPLSELAV